MRRNKEPNTSKTARWVRFVMRYIVAAVMIPVGVMIGVLGLIEHYLVRPLTKRSR